jgi:5-methylcytosine-specific restriction endonuclease McrA
MARHGASVAVARASENGAGDSEVSADPHVARNGHSPNGKATLNGNGASGRVLVLNATYEPINVCTVRRAAVLLLKDKAVVLEHEGEPLHSEHMILDRPNVIRLIAYARVPRDVHRRKITRKAVLARDAWTCQYCGESRPSLTVDHVIPRSRGGKSVWENIVASCASCNRRKGNRLPREIRMHPLRHPGAPGPTVFIRIAAPTIPTTWQPYLATA